MIIEGRMNRKGLKDPGYDTIKFMFSERNMSRKEIAKALNTTVSTVTSWILKYDLKKVPEKGTLSYRMYELDVSQKDMAKKIYLTPQCIGERVKTRNWKMEELPNLQELMQWTDKELIKYIKGEIR